MNQNTQENFDAWLEMLRQPSDAMVADLMDQSPLTSPDTAVPRDPAWCSYWITAEEGTANFGGWITYFDFSKLKFSGSAHIEFGLSMRIGGVYRGLTLPRTRLINQTCPFDGRGTIFFGIMNIKHEGEWVAPYVWNLYGFPSKNWSLESEVTFTGP